MQKTMKSSFLILGSFQGVVITPESIGTITPIAPKNFDPKIMNLYRILVSKSWFLVYFMRRSFFVGMTAIPPITH